MVRPNCAWTAARDTGTIVVIIERQHMIQHLVKHALSRKNIIKTGII